MCCYHWHFQLEKILYFIYFFYFILFSHFAATDHPLCNLSLFVDVWRSGILWFLYSWSQSPAQSSDTLTAKKTKKTKNILRSILDRDLNLFSLKNKQLCLCFSYHTLPRKRNRVYWKVGEYKKQTHSTSFIKYECCEERKPPCDLVSQLCVWK